MCALAAAYGIAGALIASYLGWLSLQNRRLRRRLEEIESKESGEPRAEGGEPAGSVWLSALRS
jgi:hypothetical protein